jgi:hypothetical protein
MPLTKDVVGGAILPGPAERVLRSLDVVSWSVRPAASAGSFEGGFRPDGRTFSICECGRSMVAAVAVVGDCREMRQAEARVLNQVMTFARAVRSFLPVSVSVAVRKVLCFGHA